MTTFPTAPTTASTTAPSPRPSPRGATRPARPLSPAARTLTDVLGGSEVAVPGLLAGLDLTGTERTWRRLPATPGADVELWLITWPVGSSTGWHDHGSASGAFTTLQGCLTEYSWNGSVHVRTLQQGSGRHFDASHIHDVVNAGTEPAVSLHAYAPSLPAMTRYELVGGRLMATGVEHRGDLW